VSADWSQVPAAKEIDAELRQAVVDLEVPQELLNKLPASAPDILFPPRVQAIYSAEHFAQFEAWLAARGLVRERLPLDTELVQHEGIGSRGTLELSLPKEWLDLPNITMRNDQAFLKWDLRFRWTFDWTEFSSAQMNAQRGSIVLARQFAIFETSRGERKPKQRDLLDYMKFPVRQPAEGAEVVVLNGLPDSDLRDAARRKGFEVLAVVRRGSEPPTTSDARLRLPDRAYELKSTHNNSFDFAGGGTVYIQPNGSWSLARPKPAEDGAKRTSVEKEASAPSALATEPRIKVFSLKHLNARDAERITNQLFPREIQSAAADDRTNSLIVRGSEEQLNIIFHILLRLDDEIGQQPAAPASVYGKPRPELPSPPRAELVRQYDQKERQASELANSIKKSLADAPGKSTPDNLRAELLRAVREAFEARQQLHQAEVAELRQRLEQIEQSVTAREAIGDQIIERRVQDLLNPALKWETADRAGPDSGERTAGTTVKAAASDAGAVSSTGTASGPSVRIPARSAVPEPSAGTVTILRSSGDYRNRLRDAESTLNRMMAMPLESFRRPGERKELSAEDRQKVKDEQVQSLRRQLEFARDEYNAQMRLLQLEVEDSQSEVQAAEAACAAQSRRYRAGEATQDEFNRSERARQASQLRLERAKTLLELYRKADPASGESGATPTPQKEVSPAVEKEVSPGAASDGSPAAPATLAR
jgi:hypothetical protein